MMKPNLLLCGFYSLLICLLVQRDGFSQSTLIQLPLNDLTEFREGSAGWRIAGTVNADLNRPNVLIAGDGTGLLANTGSGKPTDIYTKEEFGDLDLEMEFMMASASNSGIYLQGRYEIQLADSWGNIKPAFNTSGGIYERWWETNPEGIKGFGGIAPRQNVSKAPGLWQKIKISFQAPRFDAQERKISNAIIRRVELNGVVIHDNVELTGPTRGAVYETETPKAALRLQGDHGAVAFRNIRITKFDSFRPEQKPSLSSDETDPIYIDARENTVMRSFMDIPGGPRVVHAVSVGSPENVHYTYDMDMGMVLQVWRGDFLDATPMWHDRGDGSSRPRGAVIRFGKPNSAIGRLASASSPWPADTAGKLRPKGYVLDQNRSPVFKYLFSNDIEVDDQLSVLAKGRGLKRTISIRNADEGMYFRLAAGSQVEEITRGLYSVNGYEYMIQMDALPSGRPLVRNSVGVSELLVPANGTISYSILF